jgi:hypothetical protein
MYAIFLFITFFCSQNEDSITVIGKLLVDFLDYHRKFSLVVAKTLPLPDFDSQIELAGKSFMYVYYIFLEKRDRITVPQPGMDLSTFSFPYDLLDDLPELPLTPNINDLMNNLPPLPAIPSAVVPPPQLLPSQGSLKLPPVLPKGTMSVRLSNPPKLPFVFGKK